MGCARVCGHRLESGFQSVRDLESLWLSDCSPGQRVTMHEHVWDMCAAQLSPGATAHVHTNRLAMGTSGVTVKPPHEPEGAPLVPNT